MKFYFYIPVEQLEALVKADDEPENFSLENLAVTAALCISRDGSPVSAGIGSGTIFDYDIDGTDYRVVTLTTDCNVDHELIIELGSEFVADSMSEEQAEIIANHCFIKSSTPSETLVLTSLNYTVTSGNTEDHGQILKNARRNHEHLIGEGLLTQNTECKVNKSNALHDAIILPNDLPNRFLVMSERFSALIDNEHFFRMLAVQMDSTEFALASGDCTVISIDIGDEDYSITKTDLLEAQFNQETKIWTVAGLEFEFFTLTPVL